MDPATATLPVAPVRVHSGAVPSAGAAVGQPSFEDLFTDEAGTGADEVFDLDPQAESVRAIDAAHATTAMDEVSRGKFTEATLQPGHGAGPALPLYFETEKRLLRNRETRTTK